MCTQSEVYIIINELRDSLHALFPQDVPEAILFGSYARNEADDESDIDVLFLVNASRQAIAEKSWLVGESAAEALMAHGVVVSPIVENRDYFYRMEGVLPFYRTIQREGVRVDA